MSQTDMNGANAQGAIYRADMNTHLDALVTNNSGGSAPSVKFPNMWWFDSISNIMYHRNNSNTVWLPLWKRMDSGWQILLTKGPDIASSGTLVPTANGNYFDVTGTTTVTAISPINVGTSIKLHFDNILVLNHSSGLRLPGAANITTQAGDEAEFIEYATGLWRCVNYQRADGMTVVGDGKTVLFNTSSQHSMTVGGQIIFPHGLALTPLGVMILLNCTAYAGDAGYLHNDHILYSTRNHDNIGIGVKIDFINVTVRIGSDSSPIRVSDETPGNLGGTKAIVLSKWSMRIRAWAYGSN